MHLSRPYIIVFIDTDTFCFTLQCTIVYNNRNVCFKDHKMWNVLRDDFVMGAKLKDWDKKNVEEEDSSAPEDMDSDVD